MHPTSPKFHLHVYTDSGFGMMLNAIPIDGGRWDSVEQAKEEGMRLLRERKECITFEVLDETGKVIN